jgi:hypothetical protein
MRREALVVVVVLAAASSSCLEATTRELRKKLVPPADLQCQDGAPIKVIQHPACRGGVCGYTCEPDRWQK